MSDPRPPHPSPRWPELLAVVLSLSALAVSGYALVQGRKQHSDERSTEVLDDVYDDWEMLATAMSLEWEVRHLEEAPSSYYAVRDLARTLTKDLSPEEKTRVLLKERAHVNLILTTFEHQLKQWMLADRVGDDARRRTLDEEIEFWARVMLRNPRLLWYWSEDGGGWVGGADPSTIEFYDRRVLNDPEAPLEEVPDPEGILPGFSWSAGAGRP